MLKSLFSNFRSCYRAGTSKLRPQLPAQEEARTDHTPPSRRSTKSESSAGKQWRPALNAISEDGVAVVSEAKKSSKGWSSSSKTVAKSRSIASFDKVNAPVMIPPAYYATPFMF